MRRASRVTLYFVFGYALFLTAVMYHACLGPDTYYYWQWSQHLDWSYYDGSPMIAYVLYVITTVFGSSEISLLLPGLLAVFITSYFIYKIALLLFDDHKTATMSVLLWLSTTVTLRHFFLSVTYDTTLIIFWSFTFYCFLRLIQTKQIRYYYFCGIGIGLMLLSKYTGVLLAISLLITCIVYPRYRFILASKHFYMALLVALLLFSPVLYWNDQHHWISFSYQFDKGLTGHFAPLSGIALYLKSTLINFNLCFLAIVFVLLRYGKKIFTDDTLGLIAIPTVFVWFFFLLASIKTIPVNGDSWNSECFLTGCLLLAFYFSRLLEKLKKLKKPWILYVFIALLMIPTLAYLMLSRFPMMNPLPGWSKVYAAKIVLAEIPEADYQQKVIYHDGQYWLSSFISYFLRGHPSVYSTRLSDGKQYYFWNKEYRPAQEGQKIILFTYNPIISDPHYRDCKLRSKTTYVQKNIFKGNHTWNLYLFDCNYHSYH